MPLLGSRITFSVLNFNSMVGSARADNPYIYILYYR